jgi:hypothetical protein
MLRTLWSAIDCEFCGTRHNQGICPKCGADRTQGEVTHLLESPRIEKVRAVQQLLQQMKTEEKERIKSVLLPGDPYHKLKAEHVKVQEVQKRELSYVMGIVNELLNEDFKILGSHASEIERMQMYRSSETLYYIEEMLEVIDTALKVEERLEAIMK